MSVHIRNLSKVAFFLHRLDRWIEGDSTLEVSDADAKALAGHPLLDGPPAPPEPSPAIDVAGGKPKPAPKAKTSKEGDSQ